MPGNNIGGNGGADAADAAAAATAALGNNRSKPYETKLGGKNGFAPGYIINGGVVIACGSCGPFGPSSDCAECGRDVGDVGTIGVELNDGGAIAGDTVDELQKRLCFERE